LLSSSSAQGSVSIAAAYDALVGTADAIALVTPFETVSAWEDGKIYTYTRVKVDQGVAGELGTGGEAWVRTRGGVVGKIGQIVDGEAVFAPRAQSLVFLRKGPPGSFEVSARAQGQYPVVQGETGKRATLARHGNVGVLYPPKTDPAQTAPRPDVKTQAATSTPAVRPPLKTPVPAAEMIHGRPVEEVVRDIAAAYKRLHAAP
jgi:hypothetical protein